MKRYASIDFLRGIAILMMLILHVISDILNVEAIFSDFDNAALINLIMLVVLPYLGGMAGFFLMISAIGNMVSMYKHLESGKSVESLVVKQVVGGVLLLIFAMLVESTIGYWGSFGVFIRNLNQPFSWDSTLWRWNTFETIHTIAWCIILNGIIQGILSRKGNWKNVKKLIINYIIIAVIIVVLTQPVWDMVYNLVPGYPFGDYPNGHDLFQPWIGVEPFWDLVRAPFLAALAAPMEPIFPYLAVSCIGSIIGIILSMPREKIPRNFPKRIMLVGLGMFVVGIIGVVIVVISVLDSQGFEVAAGFYQLLPYHRHWAPDYAAYIPPFAWVWQFLTLNGFGMIAILIIIRLVEFRGKAKAFADKSRFVRRFGFDAFTNYTLQWIYQLIFFFTSIILTGVAYQHLSWWETIFTLLCVLGFYHLMNLLWEKVNYIGSIEWCVGTIAFSLIPAKRDAQGSKKKWWQKGALDVKNAFYNAEWLNIVDEEEMKVQHANLVESKLAYKLSLISLVSIIFFPFTVITLILARNAIKTEGKNKYNKIGFIASVIGIGILIVFLLATYLIPVGELGLV